MTEHQEPSNDRRRPSSLSSIKDDLASIFDNTGDGLTQAMRLGKVIGLISDKIDSMVKEMEALKMTEAQSASQLTLVHEMVEQVSTLADFGQTGHEATRNTIDDTSRKQREVLAGIIATLMDMNDILETIKVAVIGLTTQIQTDGKDRHCPWQNAVDEPTTAGLMTNVEKIVSFAPLLEITLAAQLKELGLDQRGQPREGMFVFFDKMKTTVINAVFMSISAFLVGWLGVVLVNGKKAAMEQVRAELTEQHVKEIQQVREERDNLRHKTEEQEAILQTLKKKAPAKPTEK